MNNQIRSNVTMDCKIIMILYKECCTEMAHIFDKVDLEICYKTLICLSQDISYCAFIALSHNNE